MKKQSSLNVLLLVVAPCICLIIADFIIGDGELFILINQRLVNPALDIGCTYVSPALFLIFYFFTVSKLLLSHQSESVANAVVSVVTGLVSYGFGSMLKLVVMKPMHAKQFLTFSDGK